MTKGYATEAGTNQYKDRFKKFADGFYRKSQSLWFSSLGLGSYLGDSDEKTDRMYIEAVKAAVKSGVNVLDTAINYRCQRSERNFGVALKNLIDNGEIKREEIILCTKAGFIPYDGEVPKDPRGYIQSEYYDRGILKESDVVSDCHAMTPEYLDCELEKSLKNLGVETLDVFYLHNPETQLAALKVDEFMKKIVAAFKWAEEKVKEGKIRYYGTATWNGYRVQHGSADHLSLEEMNVCAREAGGAENHFKFVQLPLNLAMPEAWILANQPYGASLIPFLQLAKSLGVTVVASASLLQAQLTGAFPDFLRESFPGLETSAQKSIQFSRSVPGVTTALVGMKQGKHVEENIKVGNVEALSEESLVAMFQKNAGPR